ncbi:MULTISPECIES: replication-associated recombination protein A [unclassified Nesterenkonia]|uniref:replication-associated recombination protein A n=1 Tax=unclassified Nesterenkonia TaxID=2629769 RepID=UPI001F4D316F|nr:replication-associated recombination protein A [Nesterenkonia sp. DZ6]MCH8563197.1 replication-associated recombination protein A [Nesterenkonia sp. YGD6]MCH8571809.1 replication-associated recombination protein A [Nesterenkonia sp. AY15]
MADPITGDLFASDDFGDDDAPAPASTAEAGARRRHTPLAVRMRPRTLAEVLGQQHLLEQGSPLRVLAEGSRGPAGASSVILYGPPGTGKTTLAHVLARGASRKFVELSAIRAGVKDVRQVMDRALEDRDLRGQTTVLFLDEIHRFNKAQQDALLPGVENGWVILVAATTENPSFSIIAPLLSRSLMLTLRSLTQDDLSGLITRALQDTRGLDSAFELEDTARDHILRMAGGDARRVLTTLEAAAAVAMGRSPEDASDVSEGASADEPASDAPVLITARDAEQAMDFAVQRYDRDGDQHYDIVSAFIKSLRGSDPDAALHYLARMVVAGEDPRFIARRLVIAAGEEVGMADPTALQTAMAAADAVQLIGMPEGRILLAQATVHIATAPKSNASYKALDAAIADVRAGKSGAVPPHLRDAHYSGAHRMGHGKGYIYAHDQPHHVATQQYVPDELIGVDYYKPTGNGAERAVSERLEKLRSIIRGTDNR